MRICMGLLIGKRKIEARKKDDLSYVYIGKPKEKMNKEKKTTRKQQLYDDVLRCEHEL